MNVRKVVPVAVVGMVLVAGGFALFRSDHAAAPESTQDPAATTAPGTAPRGEPAPSMGQGTPAPAGPLASHAIMGSENAEAPSIAWTVPDSWQAVRNPNSMRVATYRVRDAESADDGVDISVARAGGSTDANIARWQGQFESDPAMRRNDTNIQGLAVTLVDIQGTYRGGGMVPGAPPQAHPGWTMLAAIVAPPAGAAYFFKVLGPSRAVDKARSAFGTLVQSFKPAS
jgi:hypothetical protein